MLLDVVRRGWFRLVIVASGWLRIDDLVRSGEVGILLEKLGELAYVGRGFVRAVGGTSKRLGEWERLGEG